MVFGLSGLIDIMSDRLSVCTIPLSRYIDRRSCYITFSSQALLVYHKKTCALDESLNKYLCKIVPTRIFYGTEIFQTNEMHGASPRPKQYPPRTGRLIT